MFTEYVDAAMRHAHDEHIAEDDAYFGAIDELPSSWAGGKTLEARQAGVWNRLLKAGCCWQLPSTKTCQSVMGAS